MSRSRTTWKFGFIKWITCNYISLSPIKIMSKLSLVLLIHYRPRQLIIQQFTLYRPANYRRLNRVQIEVTLSVRRPIARRLHRWPVVVVVAVAEERPQAIIVFTSTAVCWKWEQIACNCWSFSRVANEIVAVCGGSFNLLFMKRITNEPSITYDRAIVSRWCIIAVVRPRHEN